MKLSKFLKYYMVSMAEEGDGGDNGGDNNGDGDGGDPPADTGDDSGGSGDAGYWPDDWQTRLAKDDDKRAAAAGRYSSPEAVFDALVAAQQRISAGEIKAVLPENPTDEELSAWRKDNGIPEKPDEYKFSREVPEEDKPFFEDLATRAHGANYTPDQLNAVTDWYYESQEKQIEERETLDASQRQETLDALNLEWGGNFRRNVNMVENLLSKLPESVREDFKGARLPDGTGVFNNAEVMRAFANLALELNPAGTVTPIDGDPMKGVTSEIDELETFMRENRAAYNKDEKKQDRLRELYGIRENLTRKAG